MRRGPKQPAKALVSMRRGPKQPAKALVSMTLEQPASGAKGVQVGGSVEGKGGHVAGAEAACGMKKGARVAEAEAACGGTGASVASAHDAEAEAACVCAGDGAHEFEAEAAACVAEAETTCVSLAAPARGWMYRIGRFGCKEPSIFAPGTPA